ncbi:unnamed protein product [Pseudo-nitzschia multistriata]|uniref:Hexosyltransferase n=1 Tax=Pseudo-nitzschia multistriata TaxID=183589 RepID=A0A448Z7C1_9STRA|nr:unnamed protein product [Pseudo-nitzschia multistriata]
MKPIISFFACATGALYEDLLPMYAFYALSSHQSIGRAFVEIVVVDVNNFIERHHSSLAWLFNTFSSYNDTLGPICVRAYSGDHRKRTNYTNTWRFLEVPSQPAKYTYLGDIDVFLTESVLDEKRMKQMALFGLPYSNIVRNYNTLKRRLTGVMLVETERFYTPALIRAQASVDATGNDEMFLYNIVEASKIGVPPSNSTSPLLTYRPLHGTHLSPNRGPNKRMCLPFDLAKMLSVNLLQEYLRSDGMATAFLNATTAKVDEQNNKKMKESNGVCQ